MAPRLQSKREDASASMTTRLQARDGLSTAVSPWATVAIIMGAVLLLTIIVFVILYVLKRRRQAKRQPQQNQQRQHLPAFSRRAEVLRKWKSMTPEERAEAEEMERDLMIRKSLASRTTISSMSSRDSQLQLDSARSSRVELHELDHEPAGKNARKNVSGSDLKEWEAHAQTERRHSALRELAMGGRSHPALMAESQALPIPQQARLSLQSHDLKGSQRSAPLPLLP